MISIISQVRIENVKLKLSCMKHSNPLLILAAVHYYDSYDQNNKSLVAMLLRWMCTMDNSDTAQWKSYIYGEKDGVPQQDNGVDCGM